MAQLRQLVGIRRLDWSLGPHLLGEPSVIRLYEIRHKHRYCFGSENLPVQEGPVHPCAVKAQTW